MSTTTSEPVELYQVVGGNEVRGTGNKQSQQRFLNEVMYVDYYAKQIGECLGMRTLELGVVEDADTQTAFFYAPSGNEKDGPAVNGFITSAKRPLSKIIEELHREN